MPTRKERGCRMNSPVVANKGLLIDRDGVLIENRPEYVRNIHQVAFIPGIESALAHLWQAGYILCVVTNQAGIGKGLFPEETLHEIHRFIETHLHRYGVGKVFWYYCPHCDKDGCLCRKPRPGLLLQALKEHALVPSSTWMVGDSLRDVEAGVSAGCHTALVRTGLGKEQIVETAAIVPEKIFADFSQFAAALLQNSNNDSSLLENE